MKDDEMFAHTDPFTKLCGGELRQVSTGLCSGTVGPRSVFWLQISGKLDGVTPEKVYIDSMKVVGKT